MNTYGLEMIKDPVDHILRPQLPWRTDGGITECGYNAAKVSTLTREEYFERVKSLGQRRAAMMTCMTCSDTASRWKTWEYDPRQAMQRELTWEVGNGYGRPKRGCRLRDELLAIAALIEAHRNEFESHIAETEQRREWLERKEALSKRSK